MNYRASQAKDYKCLLCGSSNLKLTSTFTKRPRGETDFGIREEDYYRQIYLCSNCQVFNNFHGFDFNNLYSGKYSKATYKRNFLKRFNQIMHLDERQSDNKKRVKRILDFCRRNNLEISKTSILDVGSGLCVFSSELKKHGFNCFCLDSDPLSVEHAIKNAGADAAFVGKFEDFNLDRKFDLLTFNKVLEHVKDPASLLKKAKTLINRRGAIYLEVPDGLTALKSNRLIQREEFYIEHYMIFSESALKYLVSEAGLLLSEHAKLHEPSGKYSLYAFCRQN